MKNIDTITLFCIGILIMLVLAFLLFRQIASLKGSKKNNVIADNLLKDYVFQNEEKEKRAAELIIANKELLFQNNEKEKRAAELIIANKELAFQNVEKERRAAELIVANKELLFQNEEKEKRAAELIIANKELAFQNEEKEKRAELIIANEELAFQNEEKEKRASELVSINEELQKAEDDIRKLNEELEQKVILRTTELLEANKELEAFSYSVSHDLRAPLRAVYGYAKMLHTKYAEDMDAEANRLMNNILNNGKKMGQLIDELLTFSRLGRKALVKMLVPMENMVANICTEIKSEAGNHKINFQLKNITEVRADSSAIKQVWINLISNAVKYTRFKEEPVIEIGATQNGDQVIYHIKDNGAGFDMRYAGKLFGVFQRLHSDDEFEGIGVGLAIVDRIITKHGGRVWAHGVVNEGAQFYFMLPKQ